MLFTIRCDGQIAVCAHRPTHGSLRERDASGLSFEGRRIQIAPLAEPLGTVTGMIRTVHGFTLCSARDGKLMTGDMFVSAPNLGSTCPVRSLTVQPGRHSASAIRASLAH